MATWMLYATCVSLLFGVAARTLAEALERGSLPTRWIWVLALVASTCVPLLVLRRPPPPAIDAGAFQPTGLSALQIVPDLTWAPTPTPTSASSGGWRAFAEWPLLPASLDRWVLPAWALLSLLGAAVLLRSLVALEMAKRRWQPQRLDGREVLVSQGVGPAVVGAFRPTIVVPRWVAELSPQERELVLRHEEEHIRAGDLRLLIASLALVVLLPWNPGLWWQIGRLRMAVEVDCDRRVLRGGDLRRYAGLLLDLGQRGVALRMGALALTHSTPLLERRIRVMTTSHRSRRVVLATLTGLAIVLSLAAWRLQPPPAPLGRSEPDPPPAPLAASQAVASRMPRTAASANEGSGSEAPAVAASTSGVRSDNASTGRASAARTSHDAADTPTRADVPSTIAPSAGSEAPATRAERTREIRQGSVRGRVTELNSGMPLGSVQVHLYGDEMGTLSRPTGDYSLADVPPGVYEIRAERIGLTTARQQITVVEGEALEVSFELGAQAIGLNEIRSNSRNAGPAVRSGAGASSRPAGPSRRPEGTPSFTPHSVRPAVSNLSAVWDAMELAYSTALRDAGISGIVDVWIFVGANGQPLNVKVNEVMRASPASEPVVTRLAQEIAGMMRFTPAYNRDEAVAVWVSVPLTFAP
jgi:hypothetical protein